MAKDDESNNGIPQEDVEAASPRDGADDAAAAAPEQPEDARPDSTAEPSDDVAAETTAAVADETPAPDGDASQPRSAEMASFNGAGLTEDIEQQIDLLDDVELDVKIELGRSRMMVEDVLKLGNGSVVELDKLAGDPVDVLVNDRLVARGEVLVLNDNFCVRVNEIITQSGEAIRS